MNNLDYLLLLMRYLHILGAIALMGGAMFAYFAAVPALGALPEAERERIHDALRARWAKVVMIASGMVLVSGLVNLGVYGAIYEFPTFRLYHMVAGIKFLLALPIFFIAALLTGRTGLAKKVQASAKTWLAVNLVLALSLVLIGGALRFVARQPKAQPPVASLQQRIEPKVVLD